MNIGIFGDSWGCDKLNENNGQFGWPNLLVKNYDFSIDNYSVSGSSFFYSYKTFLENHSKYDYNVFLITEPNRFFSNNLNYYGLENHITNITPEIAIEKIGKNNITDIQLEILNSISGYYKFWMNEEYISTTHNLLLNYIRQETSTTIFVPCFKDSMDQENFFPLINFFVYENEKMGLDTTLKFADLRICHMNKQNNEMFSEKIYTAIKNNDMSLKFKFEDFTLPLKQEDIFRLERF